MTTTARLLELLSLLQSRRDWSGEALARRLEVSGRTVRRDVDRLREMGYSIGSTKGPDGGYRLQAGSELPPLLLDDEQAVATAIALHTATASGAGIEEAALRALVTLRQVMPARLRHRMDAIEVTAVARAGDAPPMDVPVDLLTTLAGAISSQEVLRFDYPARGATEDPQTAAPRRTEPCHLIASYGRWYLLGWDLDRDDWRLYSVDRVRPRTPNGPRFSPRTVPGGDVGEFAAARFKGRDVNAWPCQGSVVLDLPAAEVLPFAGDGTVSALDDGRCVLEAGAWSWGALAASYGRFETAMQVVGPPELVEAFATLAARYEATARG